ncbi:7367_t:CDS:2, partial [Diversispora eburnea]
EIRIQILNPYTAKNEFDHTMIKYIGKVLIDLIKHNVEPMHEHLIEMSGAPTDFLKNHPIDDSHKTLWERIDSLNAILLTFLNYDIQFT